MEIFQRSVLKNTTRTLRIFKRLLSVYEGAKAQQYSGDQQMTAEAEMQQPIVEVPEPRSAVLEYTPRTHNIQQDLQEKTQEQKYERLEGSKIRVPSITLDMKIAEHHQLAKSYGIKVKEIDFKRETSDLVIEKAEVRDRESLVEKRQQIRPLIEAQNRPLL